MGNAEYNNYWQKNWLKFKEDVYENSTSDWLSENSILNMLEPGTQYFQE